MSIMINALTARREELEDMILQLRTSLANAPAGKLRISGRNECPQYYLREKKSDRGGKYIKQRNYALAEALAQRDYNTAVLNSAETEQTAIDTLLEIWQSERPEDEFDKLSLPRKRLVTPAALSDEDFVKQWLEETYPRKGFSENDPEYYSLKGERVRSKSEIILMNIFDSYPIPCKYEVPLTLHNGRVIHTDFTLLNVRERKELRWEHMGKADDPAYMKYNVGRLNDLMKSGYYPGINLILTFETNEIPVDQKVVHALIEQFLF